jgi:hypothetical protein
MGLVNSLLSLYDMYQDSESSTEFVKNYKIFIDELRETKGDFHLAFKNAENLRHPDPIAWVRMSTGELIKGHITFEEQVLS